MTRSAMNVPRDGVVAGRKKYKAMLAARVEEFHGSHDQDSHGNRYKAEGLVETTRKSGGLTQDVKGRMVKTGYSVGTGVDSKIVSVSEFKSEKGREIYKKWRQEQQAKGNLSKGRAIGTWVNEGKVYLDITEIIPDGPGAERRAKSLGRKRNEKAIYHLTTGQEIDTGGTGENL